MPFRQKYIPFNWPAIAGCPICYIKGDKVVTRDGREGIVIDFEFDSNLTCYKDGKPSQGHFIVTVDFGSYTSKYLRHDLSGKRLGHGGFW